jgi:exodeoxyribonuclease VII large subunit
VYFTLKDASDGSTLPCLAFQEQYALSGVALAVGDEVIVEGVPDIYKPLGKLSFKAAVIEPFGEGALKKAFDLLSAKLEAEGLFAPERKRELPPFPRRIALITSRDGAAIDDFKMNLAPIGLSVHFYPTSVEGKKAVFEILAALDFFEANASSYDALVVVRGGGSLESLQAFNNEALARRIATCPIPVLAGIGHEKDVTLAALCADRMVSTPTAAARVLGEPSLEARHRLEQAARHLDLLFTTALSRGERVLSRGTDELLLSVRRIRERAHARERAFREELTRILLHAKQMRVEVERSRLALSGHFGLLASRFGRFLTEAEERLNQYDPKRALALGYSLIQKEGRLLKRSTEAEIGDILDIRLGKGGLSAVVKDIFLR